MAENYIQFGTHLMIDGYQCNPDLLNDENLIKKILSELPNKIGMHIIYGPVVFREGNEIKDPGGYTGFTVIAESHLSIHTFVKRGFVSIDLYSCTNFDTKPVEKYFKDIFEMQDIEVHVVTRGNRYPSEDIY